MTFAYPLAFLVLLAIPVLILIYIIRNKYKEESVPSTYLWEVSQKFLKKKNPLNKFEHLLALIIQSLTIVALAICLAHPQFTLKGQADNIIFVLDTSASMQMKEAGKTRFDEAKSEIKSIANKSKDGSSFTLITAGEESKTVCLSVTDKSRFEMYLDSVKVNDLASDLEEPMNTAQKYLSDGTGNVVYLATDKKIDSANLENVNLISLSSSLINYSIDSVSYSYNNKGELIVKGDVYGYGYEVSEDIINSEDKTVKEPYNVPVRFYINGNKGKWTSVFTVNDIKNSFSVNLGTDITEDEIQDITCVIEKEDALDKDNSYTVYGNGGMQNTSVLIVGTANNYLKGFFHSEDNVTYKIIPLSSYTGKEGYDITLFNKCTPSVLPSTGAVWFIGCTESVPGSGFIAQNTYDIEGGDYLSYSEDSSLLYKQLTNLSPKNQIFVAQYTRYTLTEDFTPILTYKNLPVVFAGKNASGQREVNIGFDLEKSDFTMKLDFLRLFRNFVHYSNPKVMSNFSYKVGDTTSFSLPDDLSKIVVTTPSGKEITIEKDNSDYYEYTFSECGTYDVKASYTSASKPDEDMKVYSSFLKEESNTLPNDSKSYKLALKADSKKGDAVYDALLVVVILASIFFATDWILYTHEQY